MKATPKNTILENGAVITRRTITLGMGHEALVVIRYDGPTVKLPDTVSSWPVESDWPAAEMTVTMGEDGWGRLATDLQTGDIAIAGETLAGGWGQRMGISGGKWFRQRRVRLSGASLRTLAATMLRTIQSELRPLQAHLRARQARIDQRNTTLAAGCDARPLKS